MANSPKNQVIGYLGEMAVAMVLHEKGWQVYRPVIDENIDFVLTRYYCKNCKSFASLYERKSGKYKCVTNLCAVCRKETVVNIVRFIQVKTSDGVKNGKNLNFSFHAKLRHHVDPRTFYVWVATHPGKRIDKRTLCYYVFNHKDVGKFDNLNLDSYTKTDNQKTTLRIDKKCKVQNTTKIEGRTYDCFDDFLDNFDSLSEIMKIDNVK